MSQKAKELIDSLSPNEKKVIKNLDKSVSAIAGKTGLDSTSVMRALQFLGNKNLVILKTTARKIIDLDTNGILYKRAGLPERRLMQALEKGEMILQDAQKNANLTANEFQAALGALKKKAFIELQQGKLKLTATQSELNKKTLEEQFLEALPLDFEALSPEQMHSLKSLQNRKNIIIVKDEKNLEITPTETGIAISKMDLKAEQMIEALTPEVLLKESWKGKKFRKYDISSPVPAISGGKKHFVSQSIEYAKRIWLDMGFKEMTGPTADTSFWIFDTLFTPQDHPAREMQDTFFIKNVKGRLPDKKIINAVKKSHESGVDGSKGWNYSWDEEEARKTVLRTHTTGLSARTLAELKEKDLPAKFFAIGKVFRNETVDWSHGFEFYQSEGIVIDPNANFRHLLGYLKEFYRKMGFEKIRFRPSFFSYTEPSVEIEVFHPEKKIWLELGGAGIFRPEVTIPLLGKAIPVLAWGQGFDRIITDAYKIKDLREMYSNDLKELKSKKFWIK